MMVMEQGGYGAAADRLTEVFGALADPTRRAILARLADGDANVADIAAPFPMSQPAISRHLKVLERAGLISRHRQATARLSHLEAEPLREATAWLARYQAYWDERFDRLDQLLEALQREEREKRDTDAGRTAARRRPPVTEKRRRSTPKGNERSR